MEIGSTHSEWKDFKSSAVETYQALHPVLEKYAKMVSTVRDNKIEKRAVRVVISGNRPRELMAKAKIRHAGYDGRLGDLLTESTSHFMPLISDHWGRNFKWRGEGPIPPAQRKKLEEIVERAHARGQRVRFWATPGNERVWAVLHEADVDLINTDQLERLKKFLLSRTPKKQSR